MVSYCPVTVQLRCSCCLHAADLLATCWPLVVSLLCTYILPSCRLPTVHLLPTYCSSTVHLLPTYRQASAKRQGLLTQQDQDFGVRELPFLYVQLELLPGLGSHRLGHVRVGVDQVRVSVGQDLLRRHRHLFCDAHTHGKAKNAHIRLTRPRDGPKKHVYKIHDTYSPMFTQAYSVMSMITMFPRNGPLVI